MALLRYLKPAAGTHASAFAAGREAVSFNTAPIRPIAAPKVEHDTKSPPRATVQALQGAIVCYTDGSAIGNGLRGCRGGIGVCWPEHPELDLSEPLRTPPAATNNRAELTAVLRAIQLADDRIDPERRRVLLIKSDSMLVVNTVTTWMKAWKRAGWAKRDGRPPLNMDLLRCLDDLMARRRVVVQHVRAHTGRQDDDSRMNALADRLATAGASAM